ncbi:MAG: hypothetical protein HQK54_09105 [Oligoflexales bacterium]|nr:hypothetical protein [Oligoflexales bacterium]
MKRIYRKIIFFAFTSWISAVPHHASAQSYQKAYQEYIRSDFKAAEKSLYAALKVEFKKPELAKLAKLLGIVQYMLGKKKEAAKSFRFAIKNNPEISINKAEVLDESVIQLFNEEKQLIEDEMILKEMKHAESSKQKQEDPGRASEGGPKAEQEEAETPPQAEPPPEPPPVKKKVAKESKPKGKREKSDDFSKGGDDDAAFKPPPPVPYDKYDSKSSSKKPKPRKPKGTDKMMALVFLPFGVGQFQNSSILMGLFFAAAEVGAIAAYFYENSLIEKAKSDQEAVDSDPTISNDLKDEYFEKNNNYVKGAQTYAAIAMGSFFALWTIGSIEAWYNFYPPKGPVPGGRKRAEHRESIEEDVSEKNGDPDDPEISLRESRRSHSILQLGFTPVRSKGAFSLAPTLAVKVDLY